MFHVLPHWEQSGHFSIRGCTPDERKSALVPGNNGASRFDLSGRILAKNPQSLPLVKAQVNNKFPNVCFVPQLQESLQNCWVL